MNTIEKKSVNAGKFVTKQEVDTLITRTNRKDGLHNSDRLGMADSLSVWFTVEEIEAFLAQVNQTAATAFVCISAYFPLIMHLRPSSKAVRRWS